MASLLHAPRGAHTRSSRGATLAPAPSAARTDASRQWVSPATTWLGGAAAAPSRYLHVVLGNHARRAVQAGAAGVTRDAEVPTAPPISFKKVLLCIFDSSPYLSDGSKTALLTAVQMAQQWGGKVSVLVVDEPGKTAAADPGVRLNTITWHFKERGFELFEFVERSAAAGGGGGSASSAAVLVGDTVDELSADLAVVASQALHSKFVDGNSLAEFVACPLLIVP